MKTKLLAIVVLAVFVFIHKVVAQDIAVVTLQHGETMTAFYGTGAFREAVEAAEAGDLITLSGNTFEATTITKPLVIQGAGYVQDINNFRYKTTISGHLKIQIPGGGAGLLLEGIRSDGAVVIFGDSLNDFTFRKCEFNNLALLTVNSGCIVEQCRINEEFSINAPTTNLYMTNSIVSKLCGEGGSNTNIINHCVITSQVNNNVVANFYNSLINNPSGASSCNYYNNVMNVNGCYSTFKSTNNNNNNTIFEFNISSSLGTSWVHDEYRALFIDGKSNYDYRLTEEAAATYLGNDSTQVGIYGGEMPFTDVPTNPQITFKNISACSNANGKISVRVTVEAQ